MKKVSALILCLVIAFSAFLFTACNGRQDFDVLIMCGLTDAPVSTWEVICFPPDKDEVYVSYVGYGSYKRTFSVSVRAENSDVWVAPSADEFQMKCTYSPQAGKVEEIAPSYSSPSRPFFELEYGGTYQLTFTVTSKANNFGTRTVTLYVTIV